MPRAFLIKKKGKSDPILSVRSLTDDNVEHKPAQADMHVPTFQERKRKFEESSPEIFLNQAEDRSPGRSDGLHKSPPGAETDKELKSKKRSRPISNDHGSPQGALAMIARPEPRGKTSPDVGAEPVHVPTTHAHFGMSDPRFWSTNLAAFSQHYFPFSYHHLPSVNTPVSSSPLYRGMSLWSPIHPTGVTPRIETAERYRSLCRPLFPQLGVPSAFSPIPRSPPLPAKQIETQYNYACSPENIDSSRRQSTPDSVNSRKDSAPTTLPWLMDIPFNLSRNKLDPSQKNSYKKQNDPPRYQCEGCNKSYATFSGLSKHKQFHCETQIKKEFSCKYCEKTYTSLGALKMHIRTHTLPCKCQVCGKAFSRPWLLQGHIRTHTGEKPFKCQHCARAFADRSNLRAHLQTHSDVKKYSCKSCSKTFSRMSLLVKHGENSCPVVRPAMQLVM